MKKNITLWALYDFANSLTIGVFSLYFSQWLVIDNRVSDLWFNLIFVGSTILLICTAPVIGIVADKKQMKRPFLIATTGLQFLFLLAASILAVAFPAHRMIILSAGLTYMLGNYFYQFTFTFYNAMLPDIAPARLHGIVSGLGQFGNFTGYLGGLALTLPFVNGTLYLFGNPGRAQTLLPSVILFALFIAPVLLFLKDNLPARQIKVNIRQEYKNYVRAFLELVRRPGMGHFLLAFFFFNDAALTTINNFPIFLDQVFGVSDNVKVLVGIAIFGTAALGALLGGWISDRVGLKKSLSIILLAWVVVFPILSVQKSFTIFAGICIVVGLLYGATWAITRAIMVVLSPYEKLNHAFSYYNLFERFSTFVGPVAWGLIATLLIRSGPLRYRVAMAAMAVFILVGLLIFRKIPLALKSA